MILSDAPLGTAFHFEEKRGNYWISLGVLCEKDHKGGPEEVKLVAVDSSERIIDFYCRTELAYWTRTPSTYILEEKTLRSNLDYNEDTYGKS